MNTVLTEEERELQKIYKEYADERIRPHTLEIDKGLFSVEPLLKEMHELGFCGIVIPKEYGGLGSTYVHYVLAVEELSKASGPVSKIRFRTDKHVLPHSSLRHRGAEAEIRCSLGKGRKALGIYAHGTRCRLRRSRNADDRRAYKRRICRQRHKSIHHRRTRGRLFPDLLSV